MCFYCILLVFSLCLCLIYLYLQGFELAHHGSVNDAVFSPSEGRVATAGGDALVKVSSWGCFEGILLSVFSGSFWIVFVNTSYPLAIFIIYISLP